MIRYPAVGATSILLRMALEIILSVPGAAGERLHYRKETDLLKYIQLQHAIKLLEVHKPIVTHLLEFILPELQQTANQTPHRYNIMYSCVSINNC